MRKSHEELDNDAGNGASKLVVWVGNYFALVVPLYVGVLRVMIAGNTPQSLKIEMMPVPPRTTNRNGSRNSPRRSLTGNIKRYTKYFRIVG